MLGSVKKLANSWRKLAAAYAGLILISSVLFWALEDFSFGDSVWWSFITTLTIGYGDVSPATVPGRVIAVATALVGIMLIVPMIIGQVVSNLLEDRNKFTDEEQREIMRELDEIKAAICER